MEVTGGGGRIECVCSSRPDSSDWRWVEWEGGGLEDSRLEGSESEGGDDMGNG